MVVNGSYATITTKDGQMKNVLLLFNQVSSWYCWLALGYGRKAALKKKCK
jgi:hypothetical protein